MFEEGMHLSLFYYLRFVKDINVDMLKGKTREERDPILKV